MREVVKGADLYELHPKQAYAMYLMGLDPEQALEDPVQELFFGGEGGGGKSALLRAWGLYLCLEEWPGCKGAIFRRTFRQLEDTHIIELLKMLPVGSYHYSGESHDFTFPNGSVMQMRFCAEENDVYNYFSVEWDWLGLDEAVQFTSRQVTGLRSRVRSTRPNWRRQLLYTGNPIGPSEGYFLEHFIDPAPEGTIFLATDLEEGEERWPRCFLHSRLSDNPSLSEKEYRATLSSIEDPAMRDAMVRGKWRRGVGYKFREFDRKVHTCREFEVPAWWLAGRIGGHDWGYADPCGFVWVARVPAGEELPIDDETCRVSHADRLLVYRELNETGLFTQQQAYRIRMLSEEDGGPPGLIYSGWDMFKRQANGITGAQDFGAIGGGMRLLEGAKDRAQGWNRIHRALDRRGALGYNIVTPPELCIMDSCPVLIKQIARAMSDPTRREDILEPHTSDWNSPRSHWDVLNALRMALVGGGSKRNEYAVGQYRVGGPEKEEQ